MTLASPTTYFRHNFIYMIMVEKKATTKKATASAAEKKPAVKKATTSKVAKKATFDVSGENVGFKAGDVYQALNAAQKSLSVSEIAKNAKISEEEALLGIGWLLKEGKIKGEAGMITLA